MGANEYDIKKSSTSERKDEFPMFPWNLFPFNKDTKNKMQQMRPAEIQKYVHDMMDKLMPESLQKMYTDEMFQNMSQMTNRQTGAEPNKFDYLVFETHHHVYVRIPIKEEIWLERAKVYYTSSQLIIQHIPDEESKHTINLPSLVRRKGSTANYKDGVLEIMIQKNTQVQYSEIEVSDLH